MRKLDREKNGMGFPKLYYPEVYLLHGGYKNFYGVHSVSERNIVSSYHFTHTSSPHFFHLSNSLSASL